MSNSNYGSQMLAMGMLQAEQNKAREASNQAAREYNELNRRWQEQYDGLSFRAKSQIHGMRAYLDALRMTRDQLIAALKADNPNHPLADSDVVNAIDEQHRHNMFYRPETVKRTYPDGIVPDGSVIECDDGTLTFLGGLPGYPADPIEVAKEESLAALMKVFALKESDMDDASKIKNAIERAERLVAERAQILKEDEGKGFFTGMGKKARALAEKELAEAKGYVAAGLAVLEDLNQREEVKQSDNAVPGG